MSKTGMSKTAFMAVGAVFAAMFFVSSNIIPPVYILPGVPVTFQILIVALMAAVLGTKGSLITLGVVYALTLGRIADDVGVCRRSWRFCAAVRRIYNRLGVSGNYDRPL